MHLAVRRVRAADPCEDRESAMAAFRAAREHPLSGGADVIRSVEPISL
jgi:hypothetical protein